MSGVKFECGGYIVAPATKGLRSHKRWGWAKPGSPFPINKGPFTNRPLKGSK